MPDFNSEALAIWNALKPMIDKEIDRRTTGVVQRRKVVVSTAPSLVTGVIGVTEPFGPEIFVPFTNAVSTATVGDPVWIEFAYNATNAVAIGMGSLDEKDQNISGSLTVNGYNVALLNALNKVMAEQASSAISVKTANFTFALSDAGITVEVLSASDITATIPTDSNVSFPVGTEIEIVQYGAGAVTFAAASGVTINSANGALKINGQYNFACLKKMGSNEWVLGGAIE